MSKNISQLTKRQIDLVLKMWKVKYEMNIPQTYVNFLDEMAEDIDYDEMVYINKAHKIVLNEIRSIYIKDILKK